MEKEENINESLEMIKNETENIKNLIYTIRGKQVMLDSDVARLYHYTTKRINETVKRNEERFPEKFCFQLNEEELANLRSQFVTSRTADKEIGNADLRSQIATSSLKKESYGGRRYLPYVFTEQGIAMLSGLLKNEIAVKVSINIMDAFVEMRKFIANNANMFNRLTTVEYKLLEHDKKFDRIFDELQKNQEKEFEQKIFFEGQIYDAYSLIVDIIKSAKEKITIIDNYIDDTILKMLSKKKTNVEVIILTSEKSNISNLDIQKFNKEYPKLKLSKTNKFHDRFIAIDNTKLYHCGASLKDLGRKCFAISKIQDKEYLKKIISS